MEWDDSICDETPLGRPTPSSGELFVGVCEGPLRSQAIESSDQVFSVNVVITRRLGSTPDDRIGDAVINELKDGLRRIAQRLHSLLHMDQSQYAILAAANNEIIEEANDIGLPEAQRCYGFSEPLHTTGMSVAQFRGPSWFHASGEGQETGYSITISLSGARRLQPLSLQQ